jgi:hypothetical protein
MLIMEMLTSLRARCWRQSTGPGCGLHGSQARSDKGPISRLQRGSRTTHRG